MNQVFIHVGAGKTGTSALQEFILNNHPALEEKEGLCVPNFGAVKTARVLTHHGLSDWGAYKNRDALGLWKKISRLDRSRVLVTSENLHSRISARDGLAFFRGVKNTLAGWDIKIIFYIRRQSQWTQSAYEQWVKVNNVSMSIEQLAQSYKTNLVRQVFEFAEVFGRQNILVRPYEKSQFQGGNIFVDFFSLLDIDVSKGYEFPQKNANPRLNAESLSFKRHINQLSDDRKQAQLILNDLLAYSGKVSATDSLTIHHNHNLMPVALQMEIEALNEPNYEKIARDIMGREDGRLFLEEPDFTNADRSDNGNDNFDLLYAHLFLALYEKVQHLQSQNKELRAAVAKSTGLFSKLIERYKTISNSD